MIAAVFAAAAVALAAPAASRDDTAALQAALDAGGEVAIPALPDGECYRTRGLWIGRDDTRVVSDGACIVALGSGAERLHVRYPIPADAVFYVNRTDGSARPPARIRISGVRLIVPRGLAMYGIETQGDDVEIDHVTVEGGPKDALLVGGHANNAGAASRVWIHDSGFFAGGRNVVSVTGVRALTIERCTITGASDTAYLPELRRSWGNPAAGIDVEPDLPTNPTLDVTIRDNWIGDNAGPGIILSLNPSNTPALAADRITIAGNRIVDNGIRRTPPVRGGVVIGGGQASRPGRIEIHDNVIARNHGFGLSGGTTMVVDARDNRLARNTAGRWRFSGLGRGSHLG